MFFVLLRLFTYERTNERTNEWMCGWIVRALLLWHARVCPLVCTCSTEYSLFFFYCCCCWCCRLWVLFFVSFPFYFRFSRDYRVGRVSLQNTHTHTKAHIYQMNAHMTTHTLIHKFTFSLFSGNTWKHSEFLCDSFAVSMFLFSFCFFGVQERLKRPTRRKRIEKRLSVENMCATGK